MTLEVEATYQNGILKLDSPLPFPENQRLKVIVQDTPGRARQSYGLMGWQGDPKILEQVALDPDFGIQESP